MDDLRAELAKKTKQVEELTDLLEASDRTNAELQSRLDDKEKSGRPRLYPWYIALALAAVVATLILR
jgi:hypothetical protein